MPTIVPKRAVAKCESIQALRDTDGEAANSCQQRRAVVCLHDQVKVVEQDGEVHDAELSSVCSRPQVREVEFGSCPRHLRAAGELVDGRGVCVFGCAS